MICTMCGSSLPPNSTACPVCGATAENAPADESAPAASQEEAPPAAQPAAPTHPVPPQRARVASLGRYGPGSAALPTPSTLTLAPPDQEHNASAPAAQEQAADDEPPAPAPPAPPAQEATLAALPELSPRTEHEARLIELPSHGSQPPIRRLLESPKTGRYIALAAALLLISMLAELGTFGYHVYMKTQAEQRITATTQAALHATATGAAQATATARVVLLDDPLATNTKSWSEVNGSAFFQNGQYHLHNTDPNKTLNSYYEQRVFADVKVQITVTAYSDANPNAATPYAYGLVLRADPSTPGDKYVFFVAPDGTYNFARHDDGTFYNNGWTDLTLTPFVSSSAIRTGKGATNTLTVIAKGGTFTLFINGQQVETVSDPGTPYASGWIGLMVEGADMEAGFSNLLVYNPDA